MGVIQHNSIGSTLAQSDWEGTTTHLIGGAASTNIVRSATYVVAASDAPADIRAQADYVCDGINDQVEILAAINACPNHPTAPSTAKTGRVTLMGHTFYLGALLDIPPLEDFVLDAWDSTLSVGGIRLDSTMSCILNFGVIAGLTAGIGLDIEPRTVSPDNVKTFACNQINIRAIAGVIPLTAGSVGLNIDPVTAEVHRNIFTVPEIWGFETLVKLGSSATYSVDCNLFKLPFLYAGTTAILDGAVGATLNLRNRFIAEFSTGFSITLTNGADIYGYDGFWDVYNSGGATNPVIFRSGARRNFVRSSSLLTYTDNSGRTDNQVVTEASVGVKEMFSPATYGTENYRLSRYVGYRVNADLEDAAVTLKVPDDFQTLVQAGIIYIAEGAVTDMTWNVNTEFAASGEGYSSHTDSTTVTRTTLLNTMYEDDISVALTGLLAGDTVGFHFTRPAAGNTNIVVLGVRLKYQVK